MVETQRVTAFDLLVELARPDRPEKSVEPPADLSVADFELLWDGELLPLVGLANGTTDPRALIELRTDAPNGPPTSAEDRPEMLLSWAGSGPETANRLHPRAASMPRTGRTILAIDPPVDHLWLALLVEDPSSGARGGVGLDLAGN